MEAGLEEKETGINLQAEAEQRLKNIFNNFPVYKVNYDDECLEICIPHTEVNSARYSKIVS